MANSRIFRGIASELRKISSEPLKENLAFQYVAEQFKKYNTTEQQLCKAQEEMKFMASTYLCYLKSSRLQKEINNEFQGKGERSVADTAKMVGFKLPHDPK